MRVLIQRVKSARVEVEGREVSSIKKGMVIFVGIGKDDKKEDPEALARKISKIRIFEDGRGKMNLDIKQVQADILSVPQFTLYADTKKGNRPGFEASSPPEQAKAAWKDFNAELVRLGVPVSEGEFGAHMEVALVNDGPVTIWLDSKETA